MINYAPGTGNFPEPYNYFDAMNADFRQIQPFQVKGKYNQQTAIERRYLYTKIYSNFKFKLPKQWPLNYFRSWLFYCGSIAVIYTKEFGWVCHPYGVSKIDQYYNPREIIVYNQFFKSEKIGIVGVNAAIIKLMDNYEGIDDIVTKYAEKLANIDKAIDINLMNCNVSVAVEAENKKEADSIREAYSEATEGKPFVMLNKGLLEGKSLKPLISGVKNNYIVTELLEARRTLLNHFLTDIGISNNAYEKRAQQSSEEVTRNDEETESVIAVINSNLRISLAEASKISGLSLGVDLRYDYDNITNGGNPWRA